MSQVVPGHHGTVGTGILEVLASGTCWDVPSSPSTSWDCCDWGLASGTYWDVPSSPSTVGTGILRSVASGTYWDIPSCPEAIFGTG